MNYIKNYSITFNASSLEFQSTPSVGRATNGSTFEPPLFHDFNPRPPWGGRRFTTLAKTWDLSFQSTPSVGRATIDCDDGAVWLKNFNPRPPWGGRLRTCPLLPCPRATFQSTPSVGRATIALTGSIQTRKYISIHALRGEGDARRSYHGNDNYNFNPRPPWGGRLLGFFMRTRLKIFQSTPSVGRATSHRPQALHIKKFQSTPSVGRATVKGERKKELNIDFNPRPPWGGRLSRNQSQASANLFQSTPSVGRATMSEG